MSYKMLVLDLDGTALNSQGRVNTRTRHAVRMAHNAGLLVVVATGRRMRSALPHVYELGIEGPSLFCNGAWGVDLSRWRTLNAERLGWVGSDVARRWLDMGLNPLICTEAVTGPDVLSGSPLTTGPDWLRAGTRTGEIVPVRDLVSAAAGGLKLMTIAPVHQAEKASAGLPGRVMTSACEDGASLIEFWHTDVTKAKAMHRLAHGAGIERRDIIAFGDNVNDVELLAYAGLGVAMGNAVPEARAAARAITGTCDEDGIADVLESLRLAQRVA